MLSEAVYDTLSFGDPEYEGEDADEVGGVVSTAVVVPVCVVPVAVPRVVEVPVVELAPVVELVPVVGLAAGVATGSRGERKVTALPRMTLPPTLASSLTVTDSLGSRPTSS